MPTIVIKVQLSQLTTEPDSQVLIYDESKAFVYEGPVSNFVGLAEAIGSSGKAYFEADIVHVTLDEIEIVFGKKLPEQDW